MHAGSKVGITDSKTGAVFESLRISGSAVFAQFQSYPDMLSDRGIQFRRPFLFSTVLNIDVDEKIVRSVLD